MKFDYNYHVCPICSKELNSEYDGATDLWCSNGCVTYDVDPQGENVSVKIFGEEYFLLELYKEALLQWHPIQPRDYERQKKFDEDMKKFLERVSYWKANDRYLAKIMVGE
ncbi:MAG: hypothetical protein K0R18_502 [Bacillales bacterium]|jgi:hypothetical protein|nr:hypothetical protein [Bacillales bacterium]